MDDYSSDNPVPDNTKPSDARKRRISGKWLRAFPWYSAGAFMLAIAFWVPFETQWFLIENTLAPFSGSTSIRKRGNPQFWFFLLGAIAWFMAYLSTPWGEPLFEDKTK